MESANCTGCGKALVNGDWKSKSGLCRACAESKYDEHHKKTYLIWIFISIAVIFAAIAFLAVYSPDVPTVIIGDDGKPTQEALSQFSYIAQSAVMDNLKAPSTADFDATSESWYMFEDGVYGMSGDVTAENSFGVPLKGPYFVKFKCWGFGYDEYEILEVVIE